MKNYMYYSENVTLNLHIFAYDIILLSYANENSQNFMGLNVDVQEKPKAEITFK